QELAGVGVVDARDDLDQRRLAGAVVADDRVHLVGAEREVGVAEGIHATEVLLDPARLEERRLVCGRRHRPTIAARRAGRQARPAPLSGRCPAPILRAMTTCPSCGAEAPDGSRFCPSCGAALAGAAAPEEMLKL